MEVFLWMPIKRITLTLCNKFFNKIWKAVHCNGFFILVAAAVPYASIVASRRI